MATVVPYDAATAAIAIGEVTFTVVHGAQRPPPPNRAARRKARALARRGRR